MGKTPKEVTIYVQGGGATVKSSTPGVKVVKGNPK